MSLSTTARPPLEIDSVRSTGRVSNVLRRFTPLAVIAALFAVVLLADGALAWLHLLSQRMGTDAPSVGTADLRDVSLGALRNWESTTLRLGWQVAALSVLLFVAAPGPDERKKPLDRDAGGTSGTGPRR